MIGVVVEMVLLNLTVDDEVVVFDESILMEDNSVLVDR